MKFHWVGFELLDCCLELTLPIYLFFILLRHGFESGGSVDARKTKLLSHTFFSSNVLGKTF